MIALFSICDRGIFNISSPVIQADHWSGIASRWEQVGPPLRPSPEDVEFFSTNIHGWAARSGPPRALILGVTPELCNLAWPAGTRLQALDNSREMIAAIWPGPTGSVICGDWSSIPLGDASVDLVLCDGGLHLLDYPTGQERMVQSLGRVLAEGGLCLFRLFLPPRTPETPEQVLDALLSGDIDNLNQLKIRLCTAMQSSPAEGVALHAVWQAVNSLAPSLDRLAERLDWSPEHLHALESYRDSPNAYHFLKIDQVTDLFCQESGLFQLKHIHTPSYKLGDQCPTLVLQRNGSTREQ